MIKISIIVPVYNVEKYLNRCVDSLLNQDIDKNQYEIILIDDGSPDRSGVMCDEYSQKYSNIHVVHKTNGGLADARNAGLDVAQGKYIMFVDSDDFIKENVLQKILSVAEHYNTEICVYKLLVLDENNNVIPIKHPNQQFELYHIYDSEDVLYTIDISSVCAALYSRDFINSHNIRFTKGITHEDVDFNNRAYSLVNRILFTDILVYFYYWNPESLNRSTDIEKIKKKYLDDLQVAYNSISFAKQNNLSSRKTTFFIRRTNSLVVSQLFGFIIGSLPSVIKHEYITKAKSLGLLPIKGRALNWKTTIVGWCQNVLYH